MKLPKDLESCQKVPILKKLTPRFLKTLKLKNKLKFEIFVTLKKEVLDPQGKAVEGAIQNLGLSNISNIRQGKYFTLEVNDSNEKKATQQAEEACKKLLANLTIEEYSIKKIG